MENLQRIDFDGQIVITSKQLAEVYGVDNKTISNNFNNNKKRYTEGKHFILLTGEAKKDYINHLEIQDSQLSNRPKKSDGSNNRGQYVSSLKRAKNLYLWTERGALLHAKSLNTDKAWEAYERLVDFYFCQKNQIMQKINVKNENYICENPKSNVPCPMLFSWYDKNQKKIQIICKEYHVKPKDLYHAILSKIGTKYNFEEAKIIYQQQLGRPPKYPMDVVDFFPEMSAIADQVLNNLLTGL